MAFVGVYRAIYDYTPQAEGELQIDEGDLLYILERSTEDDWWKAKKKASSEDEDEPVGLIPNNYIEQAQTIGRARALYDYTRQTDEELSFSEDATLDIFDASDPDWILVGLGDDFGFVPSNYIETEAEDGRAQQQQQQQQPPPLPSLQQGETEEQEEEAKAPPSPTPPNLPQRTSSTLARHSVAAPEDGPPSQATTSPAESKPAVALAGVMGARNIRPTPRTLSYVSHETDDTHAARSPPLPTRPRGQSFASIERDLRDDSPTETQHRPTLTPGGFHMYNISEMVFQGPKRKKVATTLGINLKTGSILVAPERAQDGDPYEWTANKMTHYSREGKHVFIELVNPPKSADFHAGAKDTAEEIVMALAEMAGAVRAEGLRDVIMAGATQSSRRRGRVLYHFAAQGDDEVSVNAGDEVLILDDLKSDEWWHVRRLNNGKEGVVPSSYIEALGLASTTKTLSHSGANAGLSIVEQNRLEEQRLAKEASEAMRREKERERHAAATTTTATTLVRDSLRLSGKPKPDPAKVRTWTDVSRSFSVEAQFLGLKDGKINLHKMNGVKIAVPVAKMCAEDIACVEKLTGLTLSTANDGGRRDARNSSTDAYRASSGPRPKVGAGVGPPRKEHDWFQFFLSCEVAVGLCERYAQAFIRESMDESLLGDVDAAVLRNLGFREGDIIKVMRCLDMKFGRTKKKNGAGDEADGGGLFSGPGGTLRNNTRKARPAPAVQTTDVIDPAAFSQQKKDAPTTPSGTSAKSSSSAKGFDDDAWDVKPSKQPASESTSAATPAAPTPAAAATTTATSTSTSATSSLTPAMRDLSLLAPALEATKTHSGPPPAPQPSFAPAPTAQSTPSPAPGQVPQPTGATPAFFNGLKAPAPTGQFPSAPLPTMARQRPTAPQYTPKSTGLIPPPPPSRPLSAPQQAQPSAFPPPPLQPQMTGHLISMTQGQFAPGQSLKDLQQAHMMQQQQQQQFAQQMAGQMMPPPNGTINMTNLQPQPTGLPAPNPSFMAVGMMGGAPQPVSGPFGNSPIQPQATGFPGTFNAGQRSHSISGQNHVNGGLNSYLPPSLEPQRTGMPPMQQPQPQPLQPMPTGMNSFTQGFGNHGMSGTHQQQQQPPHHLPMQPLMPQPTGPAPPVRFGVSDATKRLVPQPTGRRANLAAATPMNPFGFD